MPTELQLDVLFLLGSPHLHPLPGVGNLAFAIFIVSPQGDGYREHIPFGICCKLYVDRAGYHVGNWMDRRNTNGSLDFNNFKFALYGVGHHCMFMSGSHDHVDVA